MCMRGVLVRDVHTRFLPPITVRIFDRMPFQIIGTRMRIGRRIGDLRIGVVG